MKVRVVACAKISQQKLTVESLGMTKPAQRFVLCQLQLMAAVILGKNTTKTPASVNVQMRLKMLHCASLVNSSVQSAAASVFINVSHKNHRQMAVQRVKNGALRLALASVKMKSRDWVAIATDDGKIEN